MDFFKRFREERKKTINTRVEVPQVKVPIEPILEHTQDEKIQKRYLNNDFIKQIEDSLQVCGITYNQETKKYELVIPLKKEGEKEQKLSLSPAATFAIAMSYRTISLYDKDFENSFVNNIGRAIANTLDNKTPEERKLNKLAKCIRTYEQSKITPPDVAISQVDIIAGRKKEYFRIEKYRF